MPPSIPGRFTQPYLDPLDHTEPDQDPYLQLASNGWGLALDDPTRWAA